MIDNKIQNLNDYWVIIKKYNGKTYYYGSWYVKELGTVSSRRCSPSSRYKDAKYAFTYPTKEAAELVVNNLNLTRKKLKYKVDNASKHLVTNIYANLDWDGNLILTNKPISIQALKNNQDKLNNIQDIIKNLKVELATKIENAERCYKRDIEYHQKALKEYEEKQRVAKQSLEDMGNYVNNLTTDSFQQYLTDNDKIITTLFGKN